MQLIRNATSLLFGLILALPLWSQNISSVAGNTTWNNPFSVKLDAGGNLYVPDYNNHVVYKVNSAGAQTIVAGTYQKAGFTGDGGLATAATLNNPSGAVPAPDGTLYICDWSNNRIRRVAPNGMISTLAGSTTGGFSGDGGPLSAALIHTPADIVLDAAGNIFFSDYSNNRIRKITPAGIISTVAGSGSATYSGDGASALQAGMQPYAIAVAPNGAIYFTDCGAPVIGGRSYRVRMVAANGTISTVAGNATFVDSGDGGLATAAGLGFPDGVALDSAGNLYIADNSGNTVRRVSPSGTISTYAGTGVRGLAGDGGPAIQATLYAPRGLAVDSAFNLYIADTANNRIRKVSAAPAIVSTGLVNGASFVSGGVVPGEIATLFGVNLTFTNGINLAGALPLATVLQGVQVLVNGTAAPIFAVDNVNGQEQINFQVPFEVAGMKTVTVQAVNNTVAGNIITVPVAANQPGVFTYTIGPTTFGAILHADYSLAGTASPAAGGETVQIFCTGLGEVTPTPADGAPSGASMTNSTTTVTIGGVPAPVAYAGLAPGFVGEYQINAQVPMGLPSGNQPVIVTIGGVQSSIVLLPVQ